MGESMIKRILPWHILSLFAGVQYGLGHDIGGSILFSACFICMAIREMK